MNLRTIARWTGKILLVGIGIIAGICAVIMIAGGAFATGIYLAIQMVD